MGLHVLAYTFCYWESYSVLVCLEEDLRPPKNDDDLKTDLCKKACKKNADIANSSLVAAFHMFLLTEI